MKLNNSFINWYCLACTSDIFPFTNTDITILFNENACNTNIPCSAESKSKVSFVRVKCKTCKRLGNKSKMVVCWICDAYSHNKCSSGKLGCKSCTRELFPGFEVSPRQSYTVHGNYENSAKFNPYRIATM